MNAVDAAATRPLSIVREPSVYLVGRQTAEE